MENANTATWIGVAMAGVALLGGIVSMVGTAINLLFGYLSNRDKLRYDAELVTVKQQLKDSQTSHEECKEQHAETVQRVAALEAASKIVQAVQKP